ncbi:unnamed protein product [Phaedon cochleariae]|uniref:PHR domain-containing protein n=1 Tax=Phaedon cochleariae TaxID=80249 RepID=A0A9N9X2R0_PHACE|nr:unnamed protein product [Phaedon cochleariae]
MLPDPEDFSLIFHEAYKILPENSKNRLEWKRLKKKSSKLGYKPKNKIEVQSENDSHSAPEIELPGNASSFSVFASIRLAVLDRWMRQASQEFLRSSCSAPLQDQNEIESDTEDNSQSTYLTPFRVSKVVGLGLRSVFELIKESRITHPVLCTKALLALLDILQGQAPEALKSEPPEVIDSLFDLLLDLATLHGPESSVPNNGSHFTAVACACLLSLVVVRGDTGKYLSAAAALLMCPRALSLQNIQMPAVLSCLQKSIHSVLLGKLIRPDWTTHGVPNSAKIDSFSVKLPAELQNVQLKMKSLACDGQFLYLFTSNGLFKIGSGYGGTIKGHLVMWKPDFYPSDDGSLVFCDGNLYLKSLGRRGGEFLVVERSNLLISASVPLHNRDSSATVIFSDGEHLGIISPAKDLARKCVEVFGVSSFDEDVGSYTVNIGNEEEIGNICCGKEFGLIRTVTGKVLYCGKSSALGIKQAGLRTGKWSELVLTKTPKVSQIAIGHDGLHAVLLTEDGSVFFIGTARRGEDGDQNKVRRQPKPVKPKKMIKVDGQCIVSLACNNGTTALINKEGELFIFGKDTTHTEATTGIVGSLKGEFITQVSLGKAHAVALTNKGQVFTFGINNKFQCGREFNPTKEENSSNVVAMDTCGVQEEQELFDEIQSENQKDTDPGVSDPNLGEQHNICPSGMHSWHDDMCMICTVCRECTGYSISCLSSVSSERNPGQICAREVVDNSELADLAGMMKIDLIFREKAIPPRQRTKLQEQVYTFGSNLYGQLGSGDILTKSSLQLVRLPCSAVQVAAGSNHSVVLTMKGEVYTFGNAQKGQLGRSPNPPISQDCQPGNSSSSRNSNPRTPWYSIPGPIPNIGPRHGRRATWVGASGDQTFLKLDESLINSISIAKSTVTANKHSIVLVPNEEEIAKNFKCLVINKRDGNCNSFKSPNQVDFSNKIVCMDPIYNVLWSYSSSTNELACYNIIASELQIRKMISITDYHSKLVCEQRNLNKTLQLTSILTPELALPIFTNCHVTRFQAAINLLCCLDILSIAHDLHITTISEIVDDRQLISGKQYSKEDFLAVNRFESHGGGWGYSGHSIEAIRFMADSDILIGGFGLFGGRGEYTAKLKLLDIGPEGGEQEIDGELLAETEEIPYECGPRQKFPILFDEPVPLQAHRWYVAWCRISGPSSDCGSSGQTMVTTEDQVLFYFKSSKKSNNGTDVNAGQIPQLLYKIITPENQSPPRQSDIIEPIHILSKEFSRSVTKECFQSLLSLLQWSWNTFKWGVLEGQSLKNMYTNLELEQLVYISRASLRLICTYTNEIYPRHISRKVSLENVQLAESIGDVRTLLKQILSDNVTVVMQNKKSSKINTVSINMMNNVLDECHHTFVSCFHAFYPTAYLKWTCLCDLLAESNKDDGQNIYNNSQRLLSAVLCALSASNVRLRSTFPLIGHSISSESSLHRGLSPSDNTGLPMMSVSDSHHYPILVEQMSYKSQEDLQGTCGRTLHMTPSRFTRTNQSRTWNTGNGSPDAIGFQVDHPGISIVGAGIYGGIGHYEYELELLEDTSSTNGSESHTHAHRWNSLEITRGSFGPEDFPPDIIEIKFDRAVPIKVSQIKL